MTLTCVLPIDQLNNTQGGGKAQGLARLKALGMKIPETWVITGFSEKKIESFLQSLPENKLFAVRSSASVEDGKEFSYAGQFTSFLNVSGKKNILKAIKDCFSSAESVQVKSYHQKTSHDDGVKMNVLLQEMIEPEISGVLFTADPVQQRRDTINISVVEGIGEELMAGHKGGENHTILKKQIILPKSHLLKETESEELIQSALAIEKAYGMPADLEWAIDEAGVIWWLQLRPVTGLHEVHLNELDHKSLIENPIYTRGNIGEMMPGPVTPLTLSTFARAIEIGLQIFYKKIGAIQQLTDENLFVHSYYNHLFFNMNNLYHSTRNVLMSKKENVDFSIVGAVVPGIEVNLEAGFFTGLKNLISMTRFINSAPKALKSLDKLQKEFNLNCTDQSLSTWKMIDEKLHVLFDAYSLHYVTSSQSGALYSTILNIHSRGKIPSRAHQEKVGKLFNNIPGVESAQVLDAIDKLAVILAGCEDVDILFLQAGDADSVHYLSKSGPPEVVKAWTEFIDRHGHRCVREAEMYEIEWRIDPSPVVQGLKAKTGLLRSGHNGRINGFAKKNISLDGNGLNPVTKQIVKFLLPRARKAVARREQTKAWSIEIQHQFKLAYRQLSKLMVNEGILTDESQIFFLQHHEIGELLQSDNKAHYLKLADQRKIQYQTLQTLSFADLCHGEPVPLQEATVNKKGLSGIPVSHGLVEGIVRLVNDIEDAKLLGHNEIMVSRFTDIGWTPFYSVIGGLITEIGSPLSHGAVVAREYGLPAVVSMKGAMTSLKTGMRIRLNATRGEVTILDT